MARYRKKQVEVEAVQWTGQNREEVETFIADGSVRFGGDFSEQLAFLRGGCAFPSDFIVRDGLAVRIYDQTIFEATYEQCGGSGEGR